MNPKNPRTMMDRQVMAVVLGGISSAWPPGIIRYGGLNSYRSCSSMPRFAPSAAPHGWWYQLMYGEHGEAGGMAARPSFMAV